MGVGTGSQLEVASVSALSHPVLATSTLFLVTPQSIEFPTSTSVRFIKEFGLGEITITNTPVTVSEAGLFADVNPAKPGNPNDGFEDLEFDPGVVTTILNPATGTNPPVAYKSFAGLTKTVDFTLEIRWDFQFE